MARVRCSVRVRAREPLAPPHAPLSTCHYFTSMPNARAPRMDPYARHVLVCTGGFCSPDRRGRALYSLLASLLEREGLLFGSTRVKRGETPCLGVCAGGPIVVVYPEGVWYAGVTPELLERIVVEHLRDGQVVEEAVFHKLGDEGSVASGEDP